MLALDDIGDDDRRFIAEMCVATAVRNGRPITQCAALVGSELLEHRGRRVVKGQQADLAFRNELWLALESMLRGLDASQSFDAECANAAARSALLEAIARNHGSLLPEFLRRIVRETNDGRGPVRGI
jgi:hypothetical protein